MYSVALERTVAYFISSVYARKSMFHPFPPASGLDEGKEKGLNTTNLVQFVCGFQALKIFVDFFSS